MVISFPMQGAALFGQFSVFKFYFSVFRSFIFFVFISDGSNRILRQPQCGFSFLAFRILDF